MAKIEIYARLRPSRNRFTGLQTTPNGVTVQVGKLREDGHTERFSRAPGARHDFKFSRTFAEDANQSDVFETVARKIVDRFVQGYNGTVFAYGQTSTGKTYTVEGSARQFEERGLIPRILSYLYNLLEKKREFIERPNSGVTPSNEVHVEDDDNNSAPDIQVKDIETKNEGGAGEVKVHISYMEIYQDTGFDLLNPGNRPGSLMLTLPKVHIREAADGRVIVRDLSVHEAATEQIALSLLFQGSTCRKVAETAMNQSSSRSHTIFTITLTTKQPGSEVILRSKLHLVDLAGSERVSKTGSDGRILQEAKYINLSLHHLEHVIVSLQKQARTCRGTEDGRRCGHIPYRNSMLTMVLRDSLGGNCLTAMIATVSVEEANICETISTLRFSQRVACISNPASRNEELDDKAVIKKLKKRVTELEHELTTLRQPRSPGLPSQIVEGVRMIPEVTGPVVTETERSLCHRVLYDFFHGKVTNPVEAGINTPALFQECLQVLRNIVIETIKTSSNNSSGSHPSLSPSLSHKGTSHKAKNITENGASRKVEIITENGASSANTGSCNGRCGQNNGETTFEKSAENSRKRLRRRRSERERRPHSQSPNSLTSSQSHRSPTAPSPTSHPHTLTTPHTATPTSEASRLSSGIGSLREEEDIELISTPSRMGARHNAETIKRKSQEYSVMDAQSRVKDGVYDGSKQAGHRGKDDGSTWARRVLHNHTTSKNDSISPTTKSLQNPSSISSQAHHGNDDMELCVTESPPLTKSSKNDKECFSTNRSPFNTSDAYSMGLNKLPKDPTTHSSLLTKDTSPVTSGSYSTQHTVQRDHHPSKSPRAASTKLPLSPPEARALEHLQEEREKLQKSQEKKKELSSNVQVLSLQVEEEELRAQLQVIAEQLASQHARVLASRHQEASGVSSSLYDACSERIAEQQLRIKQARIHQRYLSVQQQIRSLQTSPRAQSTLSRSLPISPSFNTQVTSPPKAGIAKLVNEAARTEVRHTKVRDEIEQLQVSQIEKQLHLKEMATRRKLLELRQQLEKSPRSMTVSQSPVSSVLQRSPSHSPTESHTHSPTTPYSQSVMQSYTHSTPYRNETIHHTLSSTAASSEQKLNNHTSGETKCVQDSDTANLKWLQKSPVDCKSQTNSEDVPAKVTLHSVLSPNCKPLPSSTQQNGLNLLKTGHTTPPPGLNRVNEGVYMKAVQLQRARVTRIRRCIGAATTIQRAWRTHREKCVH